MSTDSLKDQKEQQAAEAENSNSELEAGAEENAGPNLETDLETEPEADPEESELAPREAEAEAEESDLAHLEPLAVYETGTLIPTIFGIAAVLILTLAAFREFGSGRQILAAAVGGYILYCFISMMRRRNKPFMTISTEGLHFVRGKYKLPWSSVAAFEAKDNILFKLPSSSTVIIYLNSEIDPRKWNIFGDRRVLFIRKRMVVEIRVIDLEGFTAEQLVLTLEKYQRAAPVAKAQRGPRMKKRKTRTLPAESK